MTRSIGIVVFDDVEALDFAGPFEVFTTASRVAARLGLETPFTVSSFATQSHITVRAGITVVVDTVIGSPGLPAPALPDVLIVPGGVTSAAESDTSLVEWIAHVSRAAELTASICTGAFLLATAGILDGRSATTHWEDIDELEERFPALTVVRDVRWVDDGNVVSSAGISAGIDMSLHLVSRLVSEELATATARQMDYHWQR